MDNPLLLPSIVFGMSCIILGFLLYLSVKMFLSSPWLRFRTLKEIVNTAADSSEMHYPDDHPQMKKKKIDRLTRAMIEDVSYETNNALTIDALIDARMLANDTNPHLRAIRLSDRDTEELRLQHTPVLGMRQKALLRSGVTRILH